MGRQHQGMHRPGVREVPEGSGPTPLDMQVNAGYINSTKGTSSKWMSPAGYTSSISGTLGDTDVYRHTTEPVFIQNRT